MDMDHNSEGRRESGKVDRGPDPEVDAKAKRRRFTAAYKARILEELDGNSGQQGAILRREGLYSSYVGKWREQRRDGTLKALSNKRGPKGKSTVELENERLQRENERLVRELEKAKLIIDAQKKLAEVIGQLSNPDNSGDSE